MLKAKLEDKYKLLSGNNKTEFCLKTMKNSDFALFTGLLVRDIKNEFTGKLCKTCRHFTCMQY